MEYIICKVNLSLTWKLKMTPQNLFKNVENNYILIFFGLQPTLYTSTRSQNSAGRTKITFILMVWCLREILSRILGSSQLLSSNTKSVEIYYTRPWNRIIWHSCMECQGREILLCLLTYIILFLRNISNGMKISHFEILFYFGIESLSKADIWSSVY